MTPSPARALARRALLGICVAGAAGGCASVIYRVPGTEVQRLAQLPPMSRGDEVRVVPHDAPLSPSTQQVLPAPPIAPAIPAPPNLPAPSGPPGEGDEIVIDDEEAPPPPVAPGLYVDVSVPVGGRRPLLPPPVAPAFPRAAPASPGTLRGSPVASAARPAPAAPSGGVWRGAPVAPAPRPAPVPVSGGWRGTPVSFAPRPVAFRHSSGGHHGRGGGNSAAVVGGVVAVVGLVAILAVAAEHAHEVEQARTFDGWVSTPPTHILHLRYGGNLERTVPLYNLRLEDTIGVRYAFLRGGGGSVKPIARAVPVSRAAAPAEPVAPPSAGYRR